MSPFGTVSHLGPHTMSVADAALMLDVLAGPDARDWTALPPPPAGWLADLDAGIAGLRVAFSPTLGYAAVHPEIATAVEQAVEDLADLGARVDPVDPGIADPLEITTGLWFTGSWTLWNMLTPEQQEVTDPDFAAQAALGAELTSLDVQRRIELGSQLRQFMERYDLLVTPSVAVPAFAARAAGHSPMTPESMLGWTPFSYPFNLSQQPALTMPCSTTRAGLPIGVQFVGPMFADAVVLRAATAYSQLHPVPRPPI